MYGMEAMSSSVEPLAEVPQFQALLTTFKNPILGMIAGLVFTAIIRVHQLQLVYYRHYVLQEY